MFANKDPVDIIFLGNVGTGKSTLISNLSGQKFESGVNCGVGKIPEFEFQKDGKGRHWIRWSDTAGLTDAKLAKRAAKSIHDALKRAADEKRKTKLVFVLNLNNGRLPSTELYTIQEVLNSIELPNKEDLGDNKYTVIFNNVSKKFLSGKKFNEQGGKFEIESNFNTSEFFKSSTRFIHYVPTDPELVDADNGEFSDREAYNKLEDFVLREAPVIDLIEKATVINTDNINKRINDMKEAHAEVVAKMREELDTARKGWERKQEVFEAHQAQMLADHKAELAKQKNENARAIETVKRQMNTDFNNKINALKIEQDEAKKKNDNIRIKELESKIAELTVKENARKSVEKEWGTFVKHGDDCTWDISSASRFKHASGKMMPLPTEYATATGMSQVMFYKSAALSWFDFGLKGTCTRDIYLQMSCTYGDTYTKSKGAGGTFDLNWSGGKPESMMIQPWD